MPVVLDVAWSTSFLAYVQDLLRNYPKEQVVNVFMNYLDLRFVRVDQRPHEAFAAVVEAVIGKRWKELPQLGEDDVIELGHYKWKKDLERTQVQWVNGPPPDPATTKPKTDDPSQAERQHYAYENRRLRGKMVEQRLRRMQHAAYVLTKAISDMEMELTKFRQARDDFQHSQA